MTLKMTSAQVVETSVIVNNNSSFQNYTNPDDHTQQTTDTPGFKPFTVIHTSPSSSHAHTLLAMYHSLMSWFQLRMASQKQIFILNLLTNTSILPLRLVTIITPNAPFPTASHFTYFYGLKPLLLLSHIAQYYLTSSTSFTSIPMYSTRQIFVEMF